MIRLSSSITLGLALFFPIFWFVFFGSFTLFILATDSEDLPMSNPGIFKVGLLISFLIFAFFIYKGLMKLKRVELEQGQLFITNYFKTITFRIEHISKINEQAILGLILVTLVLDYKSSFGKKIRFLSDPEKYELLLNQYNEEKSL